MAVRSEIPVCTLARARQVLAIILLRYTEAFVHAEILIILTHVCIAQTRIDVSNPAIVLVSAVAFETCKYKQLSRGQSRQKSIHLKQ